MGRKKTMRFAYKVLEKGLNEFVAGLESKGADRALRKLKFMVLAVAWVDHQIWHPEVEEEDALSWAWEDLDMALRGFGESALTGAIMQWWTAVGEENWEYGRSALNMASIAATKATPRTVPRRYLLQYRCQTVRTPTWGFDLPAIVPVRGPRLREWAEVNDMDPDEVEDQMSLIEEYERMGLIDLGSDIKYFTEASGEGKVPAVPLETDPAALRAAGRRPILKLVKSDE